MDVDTKRPGEAEALGRVYRTGRALLDAARENLVIEGDPTCRANLPGFPLGLGRFIVNLAARDLGAALMAYASLDGLPGDRLMKAFNWLNDLKAQLLTCSRSGASEGVHPSTLVALQRALELIPPPVASLPAPGPAPESPPDSSPRGEGLGNEDKALALLLRHPDWTQTQLAEAIGCSPRSLQGDRCPLLRRARDQLRAGRGNLPLGFKKAGPDDLEAIDGE